MRASLVLLALTLAPAWAQQAQARKAPAKKTPSKVKVLQAVVMEAKGVAQARPAPKQKWKKLKVNDILKPGAVIRTGRKSHVALRVGKNATVLVERQSRVALPEIVEAGEVLRTRVSMSFGKADVRVDRVGLRNDFEVATPTATLAVRGTVFRITWDAVNAFKSVGVKNNKLRAIELRYLNGVKAWLAKADGSSSLYQLPAIEGFFETYILPLEGAVTDEELGDPEQTSPDQLNDPARETGLDAARKQRGGKRG